MMFINSKVLIFAALTGFLGSEAKFLAPRRVVRGKATAKAAGEAAGKTAGKTAAKSTAASAGLAKRREEQAAKRAAELVAKAEREEQRQINIAMTNSIMDIESLKVEYNPPNGHCQYQAFRQALDLTETVDKLRQIVVDEAPALLQAQGFDSLTVDDIVRRAKAGIGKESCTEDSDCWGDDGSLLVLATVFGVRIHVLASDDGIWPIVAENHDDTSRPLIFLRLQAAHYEWLSKVGMASTFRSSCYGRSCGPAVQGARSYQQYKDDENRSDYTPERESPEGSVTSEENYFALCEASGLTKTKCKTLLTSNNNDVSQALIALSTIISDVDPTFDVSASDSEHSDAEEPSDIPSVTSEEDYLAICKALGKSQKTCRQCLMKTGGDTALALKMVSA